jgi:hypothetical protein
MDETKNKPNINDLLDQPRLRKPTLEDMKTADDFAKEDEVQKNIDDWKAGKRKTERAKYTKTEAYPELPKGKLLFQCEEYEQPKEYITLTMNENKDLIKKIMDEKGALTDHPPIPVDEIKWGMESLENIYSAVQEVFPDPKKVEANDNRMFELISKYMGGGVVTYNRWKNKLCVKGIETKFDMREINAAVTALSAILPPREAEKVVARELGKKIANVL